MVNTRTAIFFFFSVLVTAIFASGAHGQIATTPSQAQIEQFKQLPKQQQVALAKQFGIDLSQITPKQSGSTSLETSAPELQYLDPQSQATSANNINAFGDSRFISNDEPKPLKPFGYDMFEQLQDAFIPGGAIPVPADYIIGPGDTVEVTLYGKASANYTVTVNNEGQIYIPELEPLTVAGLTFIELKEYIAQVVDEKTIGYTSTVAMANLRSIQVYVVGDVKRPGAYNLSSLSTITNALFISGGPTLIGSLRNIILKRNGEKIGHLDLYQVFTQGDVSEDLRLQQGDVIFIDSVKNQVSVSGEVRRPAIYEVIETDTVKELLSYAGGLTMNAYPKNVVLASFDDNYQRKISALDLTKNENVTSLRNGDVLTVLPVSEQFSDVVNVAGAIARPGMYAWRQGMTLSELVNSKDDILNTTDLGYGLILRKDPKGQFVTQQFKPSDIISGANVELQAEDLVVFFSQFEQATYDLSRYEASEEQDYIKTLEALLANQNDFSTDQAISHNELPGRANLNANTSVNANLGQFGLKQELARIESTDDKNYLFELQSGDLFSKQKALLSTKDMGRRELLSPIVKLVTASHKGGHLVPLVEVTGQVRFPGVYPLPRDGGLGAIVDAAGGLTESANLQKGEISRIVQLSNLAKDTQHLSFNLTDASWQGIKLQARDVVNFFQQANWQQEQKVTLSGEVMYPGEYTIKEGETLSEVIERAGGLTQLAAPGAAFFTRDSLKRLEQQQAKDMARNLSKELAFKSISSSYSNVNISEVQLLVNKLTTVEGVGRLVIDLEGILANEAAPIKLEDGDALYIPTYRDEVNIIGEVQVATTHLFNEKWQLEDYINSSGGFRQQADDDRIYIIRANGLVDVPDSSWFGRSLKIRAGDTIVVPLDAGYTDRLTLWEKATSIFYQLTVGLAALGRI